MVRRLIALFYTVQAAHCSSAVGSANLANMRKSLAAATQHRLFGVRESTILVLGDVGRHIDDASLCDILQMLLLQLGNRSSPLRSLAYSEVRRCLCCRTSNHG
jgi:hypothetical protein